MVAPCLWEIGLTVAMFLSRFHQMFPDTMSFLVFHVLSHIPFGFTHSPLTSAPLPRAAFCRILGPSEQRARLALPGPEAFWRFAVRYSHSPSFGSDFLDSLGLHHFGGEQKV